MVTIIESSLSTKRKNIEKESCYLIHNQKNGLNYPLMNSYNTYKTII